MSSPAETSLWSEQTHPLDHDASHLELDVLKAIDLLYCFTWFDLLYGFHTHSRAIVVRLCLLSLFLILLVHLLLTVLPT